MVRIRDNVKFRVCFRDRFRVRVRCTLGLGLRQH